MKRKITSFEKTILLSMVLFGQHVFANDKIVAIHLLNTDAATHGIGEKIGEITFSDSTQGLQIKTELKGLQPGEHGFHIHENPSCDAAEKEGKWEKAHAAGGHYDPQHSDHHLGPEGKGHFGDLPFLTVNKQGEAKESLTVKRLKVADIEGHSVVIHEGGDNYSDTPPMGGGGDRIACGVIK